MTTMSMDLPPIPDLAIVWQVVRLAEAAEAERYDQRPVGYPEYRCDDVDEMFRPQPAWDALLAYLQSLPHETLAGLYSLYRSADLPRATPAQAAARYRISFDVAVQPVHREHGAWDLAAKAPLADGLRRGLEQLGLRLEPDAVAVSVMASGDLPERAG